VSHIHADGTFCVRENCDTRLSSADRNAQALADYRRDPNKYLPFATPTPEAMAISREYYARLAQTPTPPEFAPDFERSGPVPEIEARAASDAAECRWLDEEDQ
jgi:hypothetical protein